MPVSTEERRFLKKLGLRAREVRESKGWTLEETESHGWLNWRHLQQIESGKNITIVSLRRVARIYKMTLEELLSSLE